jgi:predicted Fe-Mo cluster-binding NifX family protein
MKICITSCGDNLDSKIDPRFGRCSYFIIYDDTDGTFEAIANPNIDAGSGAGIQSAQLVVAKKASVVITGEVGPKAEKVLQAANLQIITGASGTVKETIEKYQCNKTINTNAKLQNILVAKASSELNNHGNEAESRSGRERKGNMFGCGRGAGVGQRSGRGFGRGQGGFCVCPKCGEKRSHLRGVPCRSVNCPKCGSIMVKE